MKFFTRWFRRLLPSSRSKADETSAEEGVRHETDATESSAEPAKAGLWERLLGMFKRREEADDEADQLAEEAQTEVLPEAMPNSASDREEGGESAETGSEMSKPGLWERLLGIFRRRPKTDEAGAEADATELFSWGEGEVGQPAAEQGGQVADKVGDKRTQDEDRESAEDGENLPLPGLGEKIRNLLKKKIVVLGGGLGIIMIGIASGGLLLHQQRQHEKAQLEALEKRNKQLEAENKKLQAAKPKPAGAAHQTPAKTAEGEASPDTGAAAVQGGGEQEGSSAGDCTVNNKANAAEVLKRCIENFNTADRR